MRRWLVWLYPRAWRRRYETEFLALLEERWSIWDTFDVVRGAIDAHRMALTLQQESPMYTFTIRISRQHIRTFTHIILLYTATYGLCRATHLIVHHSGFAQHRVVAGRPINLDPLDVVYAPLRVIEKAGWYVFQPQGLDT